MSKYRVSLMFGITALMVCFMAGCENCTWEAGSPGACKQAPITAPTVTTIPAGGATGVALNVVISATFSVAMNPGTINGTTFTLTGPGGLVNGTVNAGSIATFTPSSNLAPKTTYTITITTGAQSTAGAGLASNYTAAFTTTLDFPFVTSTVPLNGAINVPLDQKISATFDQAMNGATLNSPATNFTLTGPAGFVLGSVSYDSASNTATLIPAAILLPNTQYTATITTGAQSALGLGLVNNYVWTFRSGPTPDVAPTVIFTNPVNLASAVPTNQKISATFSEAMRPNTINLGTFTLAAPGTPNGVGGTVTFDVASNVALFTPANPLAANTTFTATITTGVQDVAGTPMAQNFVWTFTTGAAPDITAPIVISTNPPNLAPPPNVPINQSITATFSKVMDPLTINNRTFTLTAPGGIPVVALSVNYAAVGSTATFTPAANLLPNTTYQATITTGAKDTAVPPNALANNYGWSFTTAAAPILIPPTVTSTSPLNNATGVPLNQVITATFSTAMNQLSISTTTFVVNNITGPTSVAGTVGYDAINNIASFTPSSPLLLNTTYRATITTGVQNLAGTPMAQNYVWQFTTGPPFIAPPPPLTVNLGTAALFGGFGGGAGMTNQGTLTMINGDIGTTGASTLITGFHDSVACTYTETPSNIGTVSPGKIFTAPGTSIPTAACPNEGTAATQAIATQALADANIAFINTAPAAMPGGTDPGAGELGNLVLPPGIYKSAGATFKITTGDLTLDGQGNPNATWVFQTAAGLTVGIAGPTGARSVLLINQAQAKNVFWHVGSAATINGTGGGTMVGTIIAPAGVTFSTVGSTRTTTLIGRALGLTASVTMWNTVITLP